jgi:hypothetical protein
MVQKLDVGVIELRDDVHEWLTRSGSCNARVLLTLLAEWGHGLSTHAAFRELSSGLPCDRLGLSNPLEHILQLVSEHLTAFDGMRQKLGDTIGERVEVLDSLMRRTADSRTSELKSLLVQEKTRADEAVLNQRGQREQAETLSREVETLRIELSTLRRQSNARGIQGEAFVEGIIALAYPAYEIRYAGLNGRSEGDFHVRVNGEGHFISVEVKNAKGVEPVHVAKSIGHARRLHDRNADLHLGHLFVSLAQRNIPDKGHLNVDHDSVPGITTVWLGLENAEGNEELIALAFEMTRQSATLNRRLRAATASDETQASAHAALLGRMQERVARMTKDNEVHLSALMDLRTLKRTADRALDSVTYTMRQQIHQYMWMCQETAQEMTMNVSGKEAQTLLSTVVPELPVTIVAASRGSGSGPVSRPNAEATEGKATSPNVRPIPSPRPRPGKASAASLPLLEEEEVDDTTQSAPGKKKPTAKKASKKKTSTRDVEVEAEPEPETQPETQLQPQPSTMQLTSMTVTAKGSGRRHAVTSGMKFDSVL